MIAFFDINTIWRRKFANALQRRSADTVLFAPYSGVRQKHQTGDVAVKLPRGWAGPLACLAMPLLLQHARRKCREAPRAIVVATPHYLRLARAAARDTAIVYYCSDDYRSYVGWDEARMMQDEAALCRLATLSIFVSEGLRARAVAEYGLDPERTIVSPNATDPRFGVSPPKRAELATLPGPIFGVAGVFNARIDLSFLAATVADPRVGSLALVGPVGLELEADPVLKELRANPKVHFFGEQPHEAMPQWMTSFDVALIPYAPTSFNWLCSPMRLYDHLAVGQPIVATPHCQQIATHGAVLIGPENDLPTIIGAALSRLNHGRQPHLETWDDRIDALQKSAIAPCLFPQ